MVSDPVMQHKRFDQAMVSDPVVQHKSIRPSDILACPQCLRVAAAREMWDGVGEDGEAAGMHNHTWSIYHLQRIAAASLRPVFILRQLGTAAIELITEGPRVRCCSGSRGTVTPVHSHSHTPADLRSLASFVAACSALPGERDKAKV